MRKTDVAVNRRLFYLFAQSIVLIWASWLSIVFITDFCNLMVGFGLLPEHFPISSHNLNWIYSYLKVYNLDNYGLAMTLFTIINLWMIVNVIFHWRAFISYYFGKKYYVCRVMQAFILNMFLFLCFLLADEAFIQYTSGHFHMNVIFYIVMSLIAFLYLNDKAKQDP